MSANSSSVRVQASAAVPLPNKPHERVPRKCRRNSSLRRIFVQTDAGNVLGIEVDRDDRVQTIKKKLQAALSLPTEQCDLIIGDIVLENDFNEVHDDSPVLLTRVISRTSSTPCLSPAILKDRSKPMEIVGGFHGCPRITQLFRRCMKSLESGVEPLPAGGGLGGAYYIRNSAGSRIAIIKPVDEEPFAPNNPNGFVGKSLGQPGLKRSIRVGETGYREVAAYLLDHGHFARVPPTALVKATHSIFNVNKNMLPCKSQPFAKIASLQKFERHDYDASELGTSCFPVEAVHRIGIMDIRILNTDRHGGNILVRNHGDGKSTHFSSLELVPIDHGLCLPEALDDPYFEWLHWPQASLPFSAEELSYIRKLSARADAELLRKELPMLRESCLRVLTITTTFLQKAAEAGLCLAEIGGMMSRDVSSMDDGSSELEKICLSAKFDASFQTPPPFTVRNENIERAGEFHVDQGSSNWDFVPVISLKKWQGNRQPVAGLQKGENVSHQQKMDHNFCGHGTGKQRAKRSGSSGGFAVWRGVSSPVLSRKNGNCINPEDGASRTLELSEMSEEEWCCFFDCFQKRLPEAFASRSKCRNAAFTTRFGASCQF